MSDAPGNEGKPAEPMSSEEIDALLAAVAASPVAAEAKGPEGAPVEGPMRFKVYDFRRPPIATKRELDRLAGIFGSLSREIASGLTRVLRKPCALSLASTDTLNVEEYLRGSPERQVFVMFELPAFRPSAEDGLGAAVVALPDRLTRSLVSAALGGDGSAGGEPDPRFPSEAEREVLQAVLGEVFYPLLLAISGSREGATSEAARVRPRILLGRAAFRPIVPTETVLLATFSLTGPAELLFSLMLPEGAMTLGIVAADPGGAESREDKPEVRPSDAVWLPQELRFSLGQRDLAALSAAAESRRIDVAPWSVGRRVVTEE